MPSDIQVLKYEDVAPVREVGLYADAEIPTLDLRGSHFSDVSAVLINGVDTLDFIVISPSRLLVEIPKSQQNVPIRSVTVFVRRENLLPTSAISLTMATNRTAFGRVKLLQTFLKLLLTTPGHDIFSPHSGGGIQHLIGAADRDLRANAIAVVESVQNQLIQIQAGDSSLTKEEKLRSATILDVSFYQDTGTLHLRVKLESMDGGSLETSFRV